VDGCAPLWIIALSMEILGFHLTRNLRFPLWKKFGVSNLHKTSGFQETKLWMGA
jgi:hypothetical protein